MARTLIERSTGRRIVVGGCCPSTSRPKAARQFRPVGTDALPPMVDLRPWLSPVEDQSTLNSCSANAVAGAYEYLARRKDDGALEDVSRLFVYWNARQIDGIEGDQGSSLAACIDALSQHGACPERSWPYKRTLVGREPPGECFALGQESVLQDAEEIPAELEAMQRCIADGYPFMFGVRLFQSFDKVGNKGRVPMPSDREVSRKEHGFHAMLAVGYSDKSRVFLVRNSWGTSWGDEGYCYVPYDYMLGEDLVFDRWALRRVGEGEPFRAAWHDDDTGFGGIVAAFLIAVLEAMVTADGEPDEASDWAFDDSEAGDEVLDHEDIEDEDVEDEDLEDEDLEDALDDEGGDHEAGEDEGIVDEELSLEGEEPVEGFDRPAKKGAKKGAKKPAEAGFFETILSAVADELAEGDTGDTGDTGDSSRRRR